MELRIYTTALFLLIKVNTVWGLTGTDFENSKTDVAGKNRRSVEIQAPWQVCVNFLGKDTLIPQKCYCGGVLTSPKWVVSSAHCFRSNNASSSWRKSQFQFVLGMSAGSKRQMFKAKNIILHDGYRPSKTPCVPGYNDIALIELDQNVKIDALHVKVLQLPNVNTNFGGMSCLIGDWDGMTGTDLSHKTVSIPSDAGVCQIKNKTLKYKVLEGGSGGAIACGQESKLLAGVVQNGNKCGRSGTFLPITEYLNWISQNTGLAFGNSGKTRRKRTLETDSKCYEGVDDSSFSKLGMATNKLMAACFDKDPVSPETEDFTTLPKEEQRKIKDFVKIFSTDGNIKVYNVRSLEDIFYLIYYFGKKGLESMGKIIENNIVIRQFNNGPKVKSGFLLAKDTFECFPYKIDNIDIKTNQITSGSYKYILDRINKNVNFTGQRQAHSFAGMKNYPDKRVHFALFTFASLFVESVRNWNSLMIAVSFIQLHSESTINLFADDKWPMTEGSWMHLTWGNEVKDTPGDTIKRFEGAMELLKYNSINEEELEKEMRRKVCDFFFETVKAMPACCPIRRFSILKDASNAFVTACFADYLDPEKVNHETLSMEEKAQILEFLNRFRQTQKDPVNNEMITDYEVYNTKNLGDLFNLIYKLSGSGLQSMKNILKKNIVIRQFRDGAFKNGFVITAGDFYSFPYRVNGIDIQTNQLSDGTYPSILKMLDDDVKFDGKQQIRAFAGSEDYPGAQSIHLAHFTFANFFAESVRNWNSMTIAFSYLELQSISSITLFENNKWPMSGKSWMHATWGYDTGNTPIDTIKMFEEAMESLDYHNKNEDELKTSLVRLFCTVFDELGEQKPACCPKK